MECPNCGREVEEGYRFCTACGAEAESPPVARESVRPGAEAPPPAAVPPPAPPPQPPAAAPPPQQPPPGPPRTTPPAGTPVPPPTQQAYAPPAQQVQPGQPQQQYAAPPQQQYAPPQGDVYGDMNAGVPARTGSIAAGIIGIASGAVIVASTFLAWISASALGNTAIVTGWGFFQGGKFVIQGNAIIRYGGGTLFFTGFWSLLFGILLILAAVLMFVRGRAAGVITLILGLLGTAMAATNVVMVYTKMGGSGSQTGPASVGIGLWLFLGFSVAAIVIGIVGASVSD